MSDHVTKVLYFDDDSHPFIYLVYAAARSYHDRLMEIIRKIGENQEKISISLGNGNEAELEIDDILEQLEEVSTIQAGQFMDMKELLGEHASFDNDDVLALGCADDVVDVDFWELQE